MAKIGLIQYINDLSDGGAQAVVRNIVTLIDKNKFIPVVIVRKSCKNSAISRELEEKNICVIEIYKRWSFIVKCFDKLFGKVYISLIVKHQVKKYNVKIIHCHLGFLRDLILLAKMEMGLSWYYTCHSAPEADLAEEKEQMHWFLKNTNMQIIALHNEMAEEINKIFSIKNTIVVKNGIQLEKYRRRVDADFYKQKKESIGIPENVFVIGHVGRFSEEKNHRFIIDVFSNVYKKRKDVCLVLIGSGTLKDEIIAYIEAKGLKSRVIILEHRSDVPEILQLLDMFIFPSILEGFGIAVIEAQAAGVKCIVSDAVPQSVYLTKNIMCLSLSQSAEVWADCITSFSNNVPQYSSLESYDICAEIRKLEQVYLGKVRSDG